jgi:hypothetical protein
MDTIYYTFVYCFSHDDGYIVKSDYSLCIPDIKCHGVKHCDCKIMGTISFDGYTIKNISKVTTDYDIYGGGYKFEYYIHNLLDENGNILDIEKESPLLKKWILDKKK